MLKVIGVDKLSRQPCVYIVRTSNERRAWLRAERESIIPQEVVRALPEDLEKWKPGVVHRLPMKKRKTPIEPTREGVVYLLKCGSYFKIGKSTNPKQRYADLKIQLPHKPELVHEIQTNNVDFAEIHWHRRFESQRTNGEWFVLSPEDVSEFVMCLRIVV